MCKVCTMRVVRANVLELICSAQGTFPRISVHLDRESRRYNPITLVDRSGTFWDPSSCCRLKVPCSCTQADPGNPVSCA